MNRVEEIEEAVDRLLPEEFRRFAQWFYQLEHRRWDEQLDADSASGRLDFLYDEAEKESGEGSLRGWPSVK